MKEYYRIIECDPPDLSSIDILLYEYQAIHTGTMITNHHIYRNFVGHLDEDEIVVLRLKFGFMNFNKLTNTEIINLRETGYIR